MGELANSLYSRRASGHSCPRCLRNVLPFSDLLRRVRAHQQSAIHRADLAAEEALFLPGASLLELLSFAMGNPQKLGQLQELGALERPLLVLLGPRERPLLVHYGPQERPLLEVNRRMFCLKQERIGYFVRTEYP